jgi:ABC-type uncharacterized transport system substrate-binding protein
MSRANEELLGKLHSLVTNTFIHKVQVRAVTRMDKDGNAVEETIEPSSSDLAAAVAFLKNNNITCAPNDDNALGELQKLMDARNARRRPVLPDAHASVPDGMH